MGILEIIAVLFSFTAVVLVIKKNPLSWVFGFVGASFYVYVLLNENLYACAITQLVFAVQSIKGWKDWKIAKLESGDIKIKVIDKYTFLFSMLVLFVTWIVTIIFFMKYSDNTHPILDSIASLLALMANYYLIRRFLQNWLIWALSDLLFIFIFIDTKLYLSAVLYGIFLCMATYGYFHWRKDLKKHEEFYGI